MANILDKAIKALEEAIEYEKGNQNKGYSVFREQKPITSEKNKSIEKDKDSLQKNRNYNSLKKLDIYHIYANISYRNLRTERAAVALC